MQSVCVSSISTLESVDRFVQKICMNIIPFETTSTLYFLIPYFH
jgi:hypothetical protein